MERGRRFIAFLLMFVLAFTSVPMRVEAKANPVKLKKASATLKITEDGGKTKYGTTTIKVKKAKGVTVNKITYKSANKKIATVSKKGKVTAKKKGNTKITVTVKYSQNKKKYTKKLTYKVKVKLEIGAASTTGETTEGIPTTETPATETPKTEVITTEVSTEEIPTTEEVPAATYELRFNSNGGSSVPSQTVKEGQKATKPDNPTRSGYRFEGWYEDSSLTKVYDFSTGIISDLTLYAKWEAETNVLGILTSDISGAMINTDTSAVFTLEKEKNISDSDIYLYRESASVGKMHDDGKDGDAVASDGIYSLMISCYSEEEIAEVYKAVSGAAVSNEVELCYYDGISEEDLDIQADYMEAFNHIEDSYLAVDEDVDKAEIIDAVYQNALQGVEDGAIKSVEKDENGVSMRFSSGIWYIYQPEQEELDAAGDSADVSIMTLQPYNSTYDSSDQKRSREATDDSARKIEEELNNYKFDKNYDDSEVTLEVIKNLSSNQVVLCHTHGYYGFSSGSIIWLGEKVERSQLCGTGEYAKDCVEGRVCMAKDNSIGFTSAYVTKYCNDLDNSFIYLAACLSGKDLRLAQSFLRKGAKAVIANSETIYRSYNCDMMEDVVNGLLTRHTDSQKYYTLKEALSCAKNKNGNNDYEQHPNNDHAPSTPLIFGDGNYRLGESLNAAEADNSGLANPRVVMNECDTVYFGHYLQEDTNGDGTVDDKDEKQPIRWRILWQNEDGTDAYVIADKVLDSQPYNTKYTGVTWETCTLRQWLNDDFYNTAFTSEEQKAIIEQDLINEDNEEYGTSGGNNTKDNIYLPSLSDMKNAFYGFSDDYDFCDQARIGKATAYANERGAGTYDEMDGCSQWWLRSPGYDTDLVSNVLDRGYVSSYGDNVDNSNGGVRPALHVNLFSPLVVKGEKMEVSLKSAEWDTVELGTDDERPITWRVLSVSGQDVFLLSDQVLFYDQYHDTNESVTWENSTLRNWLNTEFYEEAFTDRERKGIVKTNYANADNLWYGTNGGADTKDYVSLLSLEDIVKKEYGFPTDYHCGHSSRITRDDDDDNSWWWLRSPGDSVISASCVYDDGYVSPSGNDVDSFSEGVRPILHFNLSSYPLTKKGTVTVGIE